MTKLGLFLEEGQKWKESELLSDQAIDAIEKVITINNSIMSLLEEKGISKADIQKLCEQAKGQKF